MTRDEIIQNLDRGVLEIIAKLFGTRKEELIIYPGYEGAANLVFDYQMNYIPMILRISFNQERTHEQIQAELHFINYLIEQGVNASMPVKSLDGNLVETITTAGIPMYAVSFTKGKGMRVPDNQYRYRENVPIEEYFLNWGQMLGKMHAASKKYQPMNDLIKRPTWFELHKPRFEGLKLIQDRFPIVFERITSLFKEIHSIPKETDGYGLIHGDFNDGNFTVDYSNGDMTVFDFDDCCYFWFGYELASAWEGGIGRTMFRDLPERKSFMKHYMDVVMEGYDRFNSLKPVWIERIPLFIQLIQVEELLHYIQYLDNADEELMGEIKYKLYCIENKIPYMGFYDSIYSPETPFSY